MIGIWLPAIIAAGCRSMCFVMRVHCRRDHYPSVSSENQSDHRTRFASDRIRYSCNSAPSWLQDEFDITGSSTSSWWWVRWAEKGELEIERSTPRRSACLTLSFEWEITLCIIMTSDERPGRVSSLLCSIEAVIVQLGDSLVSRNGMASHRMCGIHLVDASECHFIIEWCSVRWTWPR